jgi:hypothetical protein
LITMTQPNGGRVRAAAVALCGIAVLATAACDAAPAASAGSRHPAAAVLSQVPSQVSCRSSAAWLTLSSLIVDPLSSGSASSHVVNTCYTGDGTRTVAVPQVEEAAVKAGHTACLVLYQNGFVLHVCIAGGKSRNLVLPSVTRFELSTETSSPPT